MCCVYAMRGRICIGPLKINLNQAFAGQRAGVKQATKRSPDSLRLMED
jgi:hypothetical protein